MSVVFLVSALGTIYLSENQESVRDVLLVIMPKILAFMVACSYLFWTLLHLGSMENLVRV
ncbi:MAG: hypothetical protein DRP90_08270 [Planctomycetota bacterium]|nr:MAG: hypothetical protein DRP90_08270 [Planctomycetota bacterium]